MSLETNADRYERERLEELLRTHWKSSMTGNVEDLFGLTVDLWRIVGQGHANEARENYYREMTGLLQQARALLAPIFEPSQEEQHKREVEQILQENKELKEEVTRLREAQTRRTGDPWKELERVGKTFKRETL